MGNEARQAIRDRARIGRRPVAVAVAVVVAWLVGCAGANANLDPPGTAAAGSASPTPAVFPPKLASGFRAVAGMNGWTVFRLSPLQRDQQLAAMEADGVRVVRSDSPWNEIEPV